MAGCYLLADAAQAFSPFPQRIVQGNLQTGMGLLSRTNSQPLALTVQSRLHPILSLGLEARRLGQDSQLFAQAKQGTLTEDENEAAGTPSEPRVLVAELVIKASRGEVPLELRELIYEVAQTQPGQTTTRSQLQEDINTIFATGFFSDVDVQPEDTDLGVRVTFIVQPNPVLTGVRVRGNQVLPQTVVNEIFENQQGEIINLIDFQEGIEALNQWYQDRGYVLAQVITAPEVTPAGVVTLEVAEGVIDAIKIRFINDEGKTIDEAGTPIQGKTQEYVITRAIQTQPGEVFNQSRIEEDFQRVFGLGIFNDVAPGLEPSSKDPREVNVVVNISERNTGSIAAGLGFDSSELFLTSDFTQENFLGQGQKAELKAEIGFQKTIFSASLTSVGSVDARPSVSAEMTSAVEEYQDLRSQIQGRIFSSNNWENVVGKLEELRNLSRTQGNQQLEVLTLANLNNVLNILNGLQDSTVDASRFMQKNNEDALEILQGSESPSLESYFLLSQARIYRTESEPQKALGNYIKILSLLSDDNYQTNLLHLIGKDYLETLADEWQINQSKAEETEVSHIIETIRLGLLLDTIFTYSVLGDYQAGIYIANSQELSQPVQYLSRSFINFLDDEDAIRRLLEMEEADSEEPQAPLIRLGENFIGTSLETWIAKDAPQLARRVVNTIFQGISEAYRLQASRLIFFDFDEASTVSNYEDELESLETVSRRQVNDLFYQISLVVTSDAIQNELARTYPQIIPLIQEIHAALPSAYDTRTQSWNLEELRKIVDFSSSVFLSFLDDLKETGNNQQQEEVEIFVESFSVFLDYIFRNINLGTIIDEDSPEYHKQQIGLAQAALDSWPDQTSASTLQNFDWAKGFLLKAIADSHYKLDNFSAAAEAYDLSIPLLFQAEEFYRRLGEGDDEVVSSTILSLLSRFLKQAKDSFGSEVFDIFVVELLLKPQFNALLNSADAHVLLKQPDLGKQLYIDALQLSEEISRIKPKDFIYQQSERAEILYGLALAESMSGNEKDAQVAIRKAIQLNELSFPNESLSGGSGIVSLNFGHGYGIPYQGFISTNLNFKSENPWLSVSADNKPLAERRCATVTQYFACRQKYFDLYISLLLKQHQEDPAAGFDVLAFEASEQAKAFSFKRPDVNTSTQDLFAPAQPLSNIQAAIAEDDTLMLQFFLGEKSSYLWLLGNNGNLQTYVLPPRAVIEEKAQAFYEILTSPPGRVRPKTTSDIGSELSEMLFGPIVDQLGTQRLVIVADGFLQYLPFSVLPNPSPNNVPSKSATLGEYGKVLNPLLLDHEIIHLPSASSLVALRQNAPNRPQAEKELAFFANPVFNHKDSRVDEVRVFDWAEPMTSAELSKAEVLYSQISATEKELDEVLESNLIPPGQSQRFFGYDASLKSALDPELGKFRIVHFASHGIFNSKAPERSGIVLSSINESGVVQSGLLSPTYAFNEMDLSATELVVLSGCRTGLSQGQVGREGMTGLTNGLFDAGAERVVASLWSVRDDATRELMNRFYTLMLDPENPMRPAEALTEAQRSMWNEPRWQTPYNWAAFTLQGVWE